QKSRKFDIPRVVARRMLWKPRGTSLGTSRWTWSFALSLPLLLSVGMVTWAGKLVHKPVGSARLVPVRVSSIAVPRWMPSGMGIFSVGAWGLGGVRAGCWAWRPTGRIRMANKAGRDDRGQG